jgi:hypothetical protein
MNYFPNATELTFIDGFSFHHLSVATILNRIIPLQQLTKLAIKFHHLSFRKLIELLYFTPNIHTLTFRSMSLSESHHESGDTNETFQLVSKINVITNVTCNIEG